MLQAEGIAGEEKACHAESRKPFLYIGGLRGVAEERWEVEKAVGIGCAGLGTHGPAGFGGDEDEVFRGPGGGAGGEVEAVAEFGQEGRLPMDQERQGMLGAASECGDHADQSVEAARMRLALWKGAIGHGAGGGQDRERQRVIQGERGRGMHHFAREAAELVREPRHPAHFDKIARLPERRLPARGAALGEAGMAAMGFGQHGDHGAALAMRAGSQDDGGGVPFSGHGYELRGLE